MGQAGAQREPSMEEILASIRRIIENNEPGADGIPLGAGAVLSQHDADDDAYDTEYAEQESDSQRTAANDAPVAQPVSLADVAARARAVPGAFATESSHTVARQEAMPESAPEVMDVAAEELREALTSEEPVEAAAVAVAHVEEPKKDEPVARQPAVEAAPARHAAPAEHVEPAAPVQHEEPAAAAEHEEAAVGRDAGGQLVSLQTGEKVAAAFGELDAAIAAGQRRSFDEIAEEMLRPMLTQWLDDNLPTLVERLVREEIERVSRGNRR
ncbi:DUF2497 domain-containing protein [Hoeflea sp. AS60]|uniref:PopZ family protein n=1 Tax=Hoeflea sp. AS60 TaxID=3135780 RepID=UPI003170C2D9